MKLLATSIDYDTLPTELLSEAKAQIRIDHTYDDLFITQCIQRAIAEIENVVDRSIFRGTWVWNPGNVAYARVPKTPAFSITDSSGTPITYQEADQWTDTLFRPGTIVLGSDYMNQELTIVAGYASSTELIPDLKSCILSLVGTLYEFREGTVMGPVTLVPEEIQRKLSTLWRPYT